MTNFDSNAEAVTEFGVEPNVEPNSARMRREPNEGCENFYSPTWLMWRSISI